MGIGHLSFIQTNASRRYEWGSSELWTPPFKMNSFFLRLNKYGNGRWSVESFKRISLFSVSWCVVVDPEFNIRVTHLTHYANYAKHETWFWFWIWKEVRHTHISRTWLQLDLNYWNDIHFHFNEGIWTRWEKRSKWIVILAQLMLDVGLRHYDNGRRLWHFHA